MFTDPETCVELWKKWQLFNTLEILEIYSTKEEKQEHSQDLHAIISDFLKLIQQHKMPPRQNTTDLFSHYVPLINMASGLYYLFIWELLKDLLLFSFTFHYKSCDPFKPWNQRARNNYQKDRNTFFEIAFSRWVLVGVFSSLSDGGGKRGSK